MSCRGADPRRSGGRGDPGHGSLDRRDAGRGVSPAPDRADRGRLRHGGCRSGHGARGAGDQHARRADRDGCRPDLRAAAGGGATRLRDRTLDAGRAMADARRDPHGSGRPSRHAGHRGARADRGGGGGTRTGLPNVGPVLRLRPARGSGAGVRLPVRPPGNAAPRVGLRHAARPTASADQRDDRGGGARPDEADGVPDQCRPGAGGGRAGADRGAAGGANRRGRTRRVRERAAPSRPVPCSPWRT